MVKENDQYLVRIDGSRQLSPRNRRFLRKIVPLSMASKQEILVPPITKENVDPSPPRGRPLRADPTSPIPQRPGPPTVSPAGPDISESIPPSSNQRDLPVRPNVEPSTPQRPETRRPNGRLNLDLLSPPVTRPPNRELRRIGDFNTVGDKDLSKNPTVIHEGKPQRERKPVERLQVAGIRTRVFVHSKKI